MTTDNSVTQSEEVNVMQDCLLSARRQCGYPWFSCSLANDLYFSVSAHVILYRHLLKIPESDPLDLKPETLGRSTKH